MNQQNQSQGSVSGGNSGRSTRPVNIQPAQAAQLVQALRNEVAAARAAENDRAKAQQHYLRAENIKQILLNYQSQQRQRISQQQSQQGQPQAPQAPQVQQPKTTSQTQKGQAPLSHPQAQTQFSTQFSQSQSIPVHNMGQQAQQVHLSSRDANSSHASPAIASQNQSPNPTGGPGPLPQGSASTPVPRSFSPGSSSQGSNTNDLVTIEKFNQLKARLRSYEPKLQQLNESKNNETSSEKIAAIDTQISELRTRFSQEQSFAIYMKNQLIEQAKVNSSTLNSPQVSNVNSPAISNSQDPRVRLQQQQNVTPMVQSRGTPQTQSLGTPQQSQGVSQVPQQISQQKSSKSSSPVPTNATATPNKAVSRTPVPTGSNLNLAGITKLSVPSVPISSTISVKPTTAVTMKPNTANRPTINGGLANGMGPVLGTPGITKIPTMELSSAASGAALPDNGGRVLTKRKLSELVNTIGADEGDGKTTIDGDVEELLLDLADEFVSSVTGFACRLAKHRKVDSIDVKDVQLHLERNWNIRIPGFAMDEIKAIRKWQPSSSYSQKLSGVEISKSVNGNIN